MKVWRYYSPLLHSILLSVLLGVSLAVLFNVDVGVISWVAVIACSIFLILLWDSVRLTRKTMFRVRSYNREYGKSLTNEVVSIFKIKPKPHPLLDYHITLYYEVPSPNGSVEYIERLKFYKWLVRVWQFQHSPYRRSQESPLAHGRWESELGGTNRYEAYLYVLRVCNAIDPESTYHVKLLRMSPWNIILMADERLVTKLL